jgi:hypothetical protein
MANRTELEKTFTSQDAVSLFKEHTGFEFHPTVPGQLLARCGIEKIPSTSKPSRFDAKNWALVWEEMFYLALRRCRFDQALQAPRKCFAPPLPHAQVTTPAIHERRSAPVQIQTTELAPQEHESMAKAAIRAALEAARQATSQLASPRRIAQAQPLVPRESPHAALASSKQDCNEVAVTKPRVPHQLTNPSTSTDAALAEAKQVRDLKPHPTRRFIAVPFEEKDEAKWLGAQWDPTFKKWYVPTTLNRKLFRWPDVLMPPAMRAVPFPPDEPGKRRSRKKKAGSSGKSTMATKRLQKELDTRLQFLLDKPE